MYIGRLKPQFSKLRTPTSLASGLDPALAPGWLLSGSWPDSCLAHSLADSLAPGLATGQATELAPGLAPD